MPWSGEAPLSAGATDARARAGGVGCWSVRCALCSGADSLAAVRLLSACAACSRRLSRPPLSKACSSRSAGCGATRRGGNVSKRRRRGGNRAAYRAVGLYDASVAGRKLVDVSWRGADAPKHESCTRPRTSVRTSGTTHLVSRALEGARRCVEGEEWEGWLDAEW